jgi:hypothetical protein
LAGVAFPTAFLAVLLLTFLTLAATGRVPWSSSAILIFPVAAVPNLWGLWNVGYVALSRRRKLNIGLFGALLPGIIAPLGYTTVKTLGHAPRHGWGTLVMAFLVVVVMYYLIWKHVVSFLNESLELE